MGETRWGEVETASYRKRTVSAPSCDYSARDARGPGGTSRAYGNGVRKSGYGFDSFPDSRDVLLLTGHARADLGVQTPDIHHYASRADWREATFH